MKWDWTPDELIEHWTLAPSELLLLMNKSGPGRLGFSALLKFFQAEARFPATKTDVPTVAVDYLALQTKAAVSAWAEYDWHGRTIKYHRAEIRALWGFREATAEDGEALMLWLLEHVLSQERHPERIQEAALQRLRELRIEPPTADRMERLIRSALRSFEDDFSKAYPPSSLRRRRSGLMLCWNSLCRIRFAFRCTSFVPIPVPRALRRWKKNWLSSPCSEISACHRVSSTDLLLESPKAIAGAWRLKKSLS